MHVVAAVPADGPVPPPMNVVLPDAIAYEWDEYHFKRLHWVNRPLRTAVGR